MKKIDIKQTTLDACINDAQRERVIVMRRGKPVALVVGVEGMDDEQLQLVSSGKFWKLIEERRAQETMSRSQLEQKIHDAG
jgi:antitoxin (DNA-binding transcriptional repressor) of toxin-antitoxin stability system